MPDPRDDPAVDDDPLAEAETIPAELTGEPAGDEDDAPPAPPIDVGGHQPAADDDVGAGAD
jgi:hypothetical protein